ncbi:hypothetical protein ACFOZ0_22605 [Streptomyces yaanensis]|uniref:Uncharacterized protein n=1 Tax=Streptomyces yaanensis TaxID=1142239 RepID=A0ABV7SGC6_9ACTN|nr:hypothetical protein [Streptomyces sp. CGMCC 4.7035]WNC01017.1 hypothetical protein Q2K21_24820 [Streptomyces sp. CGMCC 4.7035]
MSSEVVRDLPDGEERTAADARMREMLSRPDPGPLGERLALLHFTGRRTGRTFTVPAGVHSLGEELVVATGSVWRLNFTGGADGALTWRGRRRPARFQLVTDPERTAHGYLELYRRYGEAAPRRLGIAVRGGGTPGLEEFRTAVAHHGLSLVTVVIPRTADAPGAAGASAPSGAPEVSETANERTPR